MKHLRKVAIFNKVWPHRRGNTGKAYGFAADLRNRVYCKEMRMKKAEEKRMGVDHTRLKDLHSESAEWKRLALKHRRILKRFWSKLWREGHEFETTLRGRTYHVMVTPGEGFIVATDLMTARVVCVMTKRPNAYLCGRWAARYYLLEEFIGQMDLYELNAHIEKCIKVRAQLEDAGQNKD